MRGNKLFIDSIFGPPATGESSPRRYRLDQLPQAHLVRRLRDLDMPLEDVKRVLDASDEQDRDAAIATHLARMEEELARTRSVVTSLRELLEAPTRPFGVEHRRLEPVSVVAVCALVDRADIESWCVATFTALAGRGGEAAVAPSGALFSTAFFNDGVGDVEAFLPVGGTGDKTIPAGSYAVALHRGPYEDLDRTYGALGGYVAERGIAVDGPIREHYLIGPADVSHDADLRTELCWPIRRLGERHKLWEG